MESMAFFTSPIIMFLFILVPFAWLPAAIAKRLAPTRGLPPKLTFVITFALGFTGIGGWIYVAIVNLLPQKELSAREKIDQYLDR